MTPPDTALDSLWMPFTSNRAFKTKPKLLTAAKGMFYTSHDGREILDGTAGLWCVNAGHGRANRSSRRSSATRRRRLDLRPQSFQIWAHPLAFETASKRLARICCPAISISMFFTNSGSEAVDTALKIAHRPISASAAKARATRLIGRERGYHGVGFGGISVGGIVSNRKTFGSLLTGRRSFAAIPIMLEHNAFSARASRSMGRASR